MIVMAVIVRCTTIDRFAVFSRFISRPAAMFWFLEVKDFTVLGVQSASVSNKKKKKSKKKILTNELHFGLPPHVSFISDSVSETIGSLRQPQAGSLDLIYKN